MRNAFNLFLLSLACFGFWVFSSTQLVGRLVGLLPGSVAHRSFEGVSVHEIVACLLFALWAFLAARFGRELFTQPAFRFIALVIPFLVFLGMHGAFQRSSLTVAFGARMLVLGGLVLFATWLGSRGQAAAGRGRR